MEWIDINVKMPEIFVDVLIYHSTNGCFMAQWLLPGEWHLYYSDTGLKKMSSWQDSGKVTHWMPLPKKP